MFRILTISIFLLFSSKSFGQTVSFDLVPQANIASTTLTSQGMNVQITGAANSRYQLFGSNSANGPYSQVGFIVTNASGSGTIVDPAALTNPTRFYKAPFFTYPGNTPQATQNSVSLLSNGNYFFTFTGVPYGLYEIQFASNMAAYLSSNGQTPLTYSYEASVRADATGKFTYELMTAPITPMPTPTPTPGTAPSWASLYLQAYAIGWVNSATPSTSLTIPLKGNLSPHATADRFYKDSACTQLLLSTTPASLSAGVSTAVFNQNAVNNIYANFTDIFSQTSSCQQVMQYVHDTIPPQVNTFAIAINSVSSTNIIASLYSNIFGATQMAMTTTANCGGTLTWKTFNANSSFYLPLQNGTQTIWAIYKDAAGNLSTCYSDSLSFQAAPPSITFQSPSQLVSGASRVQLIVSAGGAPVLSYQWFKNGVALSGATASTFTIASAQPSDAASYTVKVTNNYGNVTSSAIALTVTPAPTIVTQPVSQTIAAGSNATMSVVATANGAISYQWMFNGVDIPNATSSTYSITGAQTSNTGGYSVRITNKVNGASSSVVSASVTLTVNPQAPIIGTQPLAQSLPYNNNVSFSVAATGTAPLSFQWQKNGVNLVDGTKVAGSTTSTLKLSSIQSADAGNYSVLVSNSAGSTASATAALTVTNPLTITTQPLSQTVAFNAAASMSVVASGGTLTYQWTKDGVNLANGGRISGATAATLSITGAQPSDAGSYIVRITNAGGTVPSNAAILTVKAQPPSALTYLRSSASYFAGYSITPNTPSNSGGPIDSYTVSPALPAGLILDSRTGWISGTPTSVQLAQNYTITATNTGGSTTAIVSIAVKASQIQNFSYSPSAVTVGINSPAIRMVPSLDGGDPTVRYALNAGSLPPGIFLDPVGGFVSGSPTASWATSAYSIKATNSISSLLAPISIFPAATSGTPKLNVRYNLSIVGGSSGNGVSLAASANQQTISLVLTNDGNGTLNLNPASLASPYRDGTVGFYIMNNISVSSLAPGQSTTISVVLGSTTANPTNNGGGIQANTLMIPSNDPSVANGLYSVALSGSLLNSFELSFSKAGTSLASGNPIGFGSVNLNSAAVNIPITVGTKQVCDSWTCSSYTMYVSADLNGDHSPFSVSPLRFNLAKGGTNTMNITFNPANLPPGNYQDLLIVGFTGTGTGSVAGSSAQSMYFFPLSATISAAGATAQQVLSVSSNGQTFGPNMDIFLGTTPRGSLITRTIQLKNISGGIIKAIPNSSGFTVTSQNPSEFPVVQQIDQTNWANNEVRNLNVAFAGSSMANAVRSGTLVLTYTNPNVARSLGYFLINLSGMSPNITNSASGISVAANNRLIGNGQAAEVDLNSVISGSTSPTTQITVKNTSSSPISVTQVATSDPGVILDGFSPFSLATNGSNSFNLKMNTQSSGIKAATVTITYQAGSATQSFSFKAGGLIWTAKNEVLSTDTSCHPGGANPCTYQANPNYTAFGSEALALAKAQTEAQFSSLISTLTFNDPEFKLKTMLPASDLGTRLFNLVVASNRLKKSLGATAFVANWANALFQARKAAAPAGTSDDVIKKTILTDIQNLLASVIDNGNGDPLATARSQLLMSIANIKQFNALSRNYAAFELTKGVETVSNINSVGRYFLRNTLANIYIGTDPTKDELTKILNPVLKALTDPIAKAPIVKAIIAHYPEFYYAMKGN